MQARRKQADPEPGEFRPLKRVMLTDEVSRNLFAEYEEHRRGPRGREEIGWLLMGRRVEEEATVLATLPAGAGRDAGAGHVRFNSEAQALASRIVRQEDKRLSLLGVVHTHPGSMRHPSSGDLRGDREWVKALRGGQGVFAIGTADAPPGEAGPAAWQPDGHVQCLGPLRFSWYTLLRGEGKYRPCPVALTIGPDLAGPLRPAWPAIEAHAGRLDRLARQQAGVRFAAEGGTLTVTVPLAGGDALQARLGGESVQYLLFRQGQVLAPDLSEPRIDRGVYLLLAELAGREIS